MNFQEVKVSDLFEFIKDSRASRLTKKFIDANKWDFIVYSWNTIEWYFWKTDTYSFKSESFYNDFIILISTVWNAWEMKIVKDAKFSLSQNCWILVQKYDQNDLFAPYIKEILYRRIYSSLWDSSYKSLLKKQIEETLIKIPLRKDWKFDLEKQKEIAVQYEKLEKVKNKLGMTKEDIENKNLEIEKIWNYKEISIKALFDLQRWKSIYTRQYWNSHKWDSPVYAAWKETLTFISTFDFDGEYLTWATNWFAWHLKKVNWKFSINADRWIFVPKNENIDINFIGYSIKWDLRNLTKWRLGDKWKNEFTKLSPQKIEDNIFVRVPIKENWEFDLEKQRKIASKYEKLEKAQKLLIEELEYLEKVKVEI